MIALDPFDLAILRRLQVNNQQPLREIAEAVHLSAASVQRRIRRLEEGGVIAAHEARIAPEAVGLSLTIIVTVELERETPADIDAAKQLFLAAPEVQQCHYVTGESDFVLVVVVAQMADYEAFTRRVLFASGNLRKFRTMVSMDRVKTGQRLSF